MRMTKIGGTIGPASDSRERIQELLAAGMDVARLNFSHGTHAEHGARMATLKEEAAKANKHLAIILDTKGPEIRTGMVPEAGINLINGAGFVLDTKADEGTADRVGITYTALWQELTPGMHVLIDDGELDLEVVAIEPELIQTVVRNGGILKSQKGVNVPGAPILLPAVMDKDVADIRFGLEQGIDFIAASFCRKAEDILAVRRIVEEAGANVHIIAKIESTEGLRNLDAILEVADSLMVARGDLGVEIPVEEVPIRQKEIIAKCNALGKPVIVATQMLDSMIRHPRPTRAEASDVANAIIDGTDAVMLSGETAAGQFPIEAVKMMDKIAVRTESTFLGTRKERHEHLSVAEAISYASYTVASDLDAAAILTPSHSGLTTRMVAKYRPKAWIIGVTPFPETARKMSLLWGVIPVVVPESKGTDQLLAATINAAQCMDYVKTGDMVVITAGVPVGKVGTTNLIKVQVVADVLAKGTGIGRKSYSGTARVVHKPDGVNFADGDILVAMATDAGFVALIGRAGALVVEEGGLTSHAAIVALQYGIPVIVGANECMQKIKDGQTITVEASTGVIYDGTASIL